MEHILRCNKEGHWRAHGSGRGFAQTRPFRRICHGLTKVLRTRIKAGKRRPLSATIITQQPSWRIHRSSKAKGVAVHRLLMDNLMAPGSVRPGDQFSLCCYEASRAFTSTYKLRPVAAEQIVLHPSLPIGTRFDALFRNERDKLVLVSWKTGAGATNECEWKRTRTQLAWEWMTIEAWRCPDEERISAAYVVYLGAANVMPSRRLVGFYAENRLARTDAAQLYQELVAKLNR